MKILERETPRYAACRDPAELVQDLLLLRPPRRSVTL
jgi:hypothetical protein